MVWLKRNECQYLPCDLTALSALSPVLLSESESVKTSIRKGGVQSADQKLESQQ